MRIPYYIEGEKVVIEAATAAEVLDQILVLEAKVEDEVLVLDE